MSLPCLQNVLMITSFFSHKISPLNSRINIIVFFKIFNPLCCCTRQATKRTSTTTFDLWVWPCIEDAVVDLQLLHEAVVWPDDRSAIFHVSQSYIQRPALLLHGVSDHCGAGAWNAHLAVHEHCFSTLPATQEDNSLSSWKAVPPSPRKIKGPKS